MVAGRRLTRADWIDVARKVLVKSGIDDVKVDRLATRMKVTRGSFYWHFEDRQSLLDALLDDWRGHNVREIEQIAARWAVSDLDFVEVIRIWLAEDPIVPQFDIAVRAWAKKSSAVAKMVHEIDDAWVALLQGFFRRAGLGEDESLVRARIIYFHQIGYYALAIEENIEVRARLVPFYYEVLTGQRPTPALEQLVQSIIQNPAKPKRKRTAPRSRPNPS
jgi:AcrR family transcriptional regulator